MKIEIASRIASRYLCVGLQICMIVYPTASASGKKNGPAKSRSEYISRVQKKAVPEPARTLGSLWTPGEVSDLASDYRARRIGDTLMIEISVQTAASQSSKVDGQHTPQTSSSTAGEATETNTQGSTSPTNSDSATDSNSSFRTNMTGQVVAVLASGQLVVEAQRKTFMDKRLEEVTIRGVVRPNDISSKNTVPSAALSSLEIMMNGKDILAEGAHGTNRVTQALRKLIGFW